MPFSVSVITVKCHGSYLRIYWNLKPVKGSHSVYPCKYFAHEIHGIALIPHEIIWWNFTVCVVMFTLTQGWYINLTMVNTWHLTEHVLKCIVCIVNELYSIPSINLASEGRLVNLNSCHTLRTYSCPQKALTWSYTVSEIQKFCDLISCFEK